MRVLYVKMDKLVEKKLFERLLPRAARPLCLCFTPVVGQFELQPERGETKDKHVYKQYN